MAVAFDVLWKPGLRCLLSRENLNSGFFSIVHLNIDETFDVLNRFQQYKVSQILDIENLLNLKSKLYPCYYGNHDLLEFEVHKML